MANMIGVLTDDDRFAFLRIPKHGAARAYEVVDAESLAITPIGHVWANRPKTWMAVGRARIKRGPFPTRLAAARALVETTEGI